MLEVYKLSPVNKPFLPEKIKGTLIGKAYDYYRRKTGETPFSASLSGLRDKEFDSYLKKAMPIIGLNTDCECFYFICMRSLKIGW